MLPRGASHGTAINQKLCAPIARGSKHGGEPCEARRAQQGTPSTSQSFAGHSPRSFPATLSACITCISCAVKKTPTINTSASPKTFGQELPTTTKGRIRPRLPIGSGIFKPISRFRQRNRRYLSRSISNPVRAMRLPGDDCGKDCHAVAYAKAGSLPIHAHAAISLCFPGEEDVLEAQVVRSASP